MTIEEKAAEQAIIDEVKKANQAAEIYAVHRGGQLIVFRPPTDVEWDRFIATVDADKSQAVNVVISGCVLHPSQIAFQQFRKRFPAAFLGDGSLLEEIRKVAGGGEKEEAKKV